MLGNVENLISGSTDSYLRSSVAYKNFIANPFATHLVDGLEGYPLSRSIVLCSRKWQGRVFAIAPTDEIAHDLYLDIANDDNVPVLYFPGNGKRLYSPPVNGKEEYAQSDALSRINDLKSGIIVSSVRSFCSPVITPSSLTSASLLIRLHDHFDSMAIATRLTDAGYFRTNNCYDEGSFVVRGEVMEIYPFSSDAPIRIYAEWDEVVKIASFDAITQKGEKTYPKVTISLLSEDAEKSAHYGTFSSYLRDEDYLYLVGKERVDISLKALMNEAKASFKDAYQEDAKAIVPDKLLFDLSAYAQRKTAKTVVVDIASPSSDHLDISGAHSYFGNVSFFKDELKNYLADRWHVVIIAPTIVQKERLEKVLAEAPGVQYDIAELSSGFSIDSQKLFVILDEEIFGRKRARQKAVVSVSSAPIDSFVDLKEGDFVVHINYGIGQFVRIERAKTSRFERDYIKIKYANEEYLYVPIEQANLVQRYIGSEGRKPKLDAMGGAGWTKKKEKAMKNAHELASQLIALYAKRQNSYGFPFQKDNDWQMQFEAAFPYTETPDQLTCVDDIKRDMESDKVMDRLVCGDVGYGKTEIAFRAAFKAVMSGKQVAFLAPTTILAEQHYRKFLDRLGHFPVKCALLSRIIRASEVKKILIQLKEGQVDVLFGTHKILQKTVVFKNLGLLIVDEEQRFGVKDKEKIKQMKINVDSLALSATPIPRTLYMSLLKVRDMSLLTTAPRERLPIKTLIRDYDLMLVKDAIRRELDRGGQVFYLHNRIEDLADITYTLRQMVPGAIIESAHGQMNPDDLEDVMHRFLYEGVQVLVSTTIIENGIDIPNVNTIIIDHAERFGLSQLYQLRGRVGRGDRQAYCLLLYPDEESLNDDAVKRLKVLSEHTQLGSGFKVAMKDMEIRGAGNILGQEQSGELEAVGLDLYMKILDEEINRLSEGESSAPDREVYLELDYSGFIPDAYIQDPAIKLEVYKKIASVVSDPQLQGLTDELEDRFGPLPVEVENLLCIAQIRIVCRRLEIYHLSESRGLVQLEFSHLVAINPTKVINLMKYSGGKVHLDSKRVNYMKMETSAVSLKDKALFILEMLKRLE